MNEKKKKNKFIFYYLFSITYINSARSAHAHLALFASNNELLNKC